MRRIAFASAYIGATNEPAVRLAEKIVRHAYPSSAAALADLLDGYAGELNVRAVLLASEPASPTQLVFKELHDGKDSPVRQGRPSLRQIGESTRMPSLPGERHAQQQEVRR